MEITGKIIQILPLQSGESKSSGKPWQLQSYVLETVEQYPRKVCFEIFGEQRIKDNPCSMDQLVTVSFDLESREFNGRWYTSVRAWRVVDAAAATEASAAPTAVVPQAAAPAAQTAPAAPAANTAVFDASADESEDLPF